MNREKFYILLAFIIWIWALSYTLKLHEGFRVIFSDPVSPINNFSAPDRQDIWGQKQ